jgi:hypothetical protein
VSSHVPSWRCSATRSREVRQWLSEICPRHWTGCCRELQSPGLHAHLFFFLWGYVKINVYASSVDTTKRLWRRIQQYVIQRQNTSGNFERLRISLSRRAEFCAGGHGSHFEHLLQEYKNKEVIHSSLICFLVTNNPLYLGFNLWLWNLKLQYLQLLRKTLKVNIRKNVLITWCPRHVIMRQICIHIYDFQLMPN